MPLPFILLYCFLIALTPVAVSQELTGLSAQWDDSFREWYIFAFEGEEEIEGELELRWPFNNNWREWEYRIGDERGEIRQKWDDNPNIWEIRGGGQVIVARTIWQNDFSQWRIESDNVSITLESKWRNLADEWRLREEKYGYYDIYTEYEGDPRDWIIKDGLNPGISIHVKMAIAFIAVYHSIPKI